MRLNEYNYIIKKYKNSYGKQINKIREEYKNNIKKINIEKFKNYSTDYRNSIINLIVELSEIFFNNYKGNVAVAVTGSLARYTNTIYSDVDINFLTDTNDFKSIIDIEDKINYIIQKVIGFRGRDKIHTMVVYLPLINNIKYDFIYKNKYPMKFDDATIYFYCRKNAEKLMFENYNSTRNFYDLINYLNENDTSQKLNEWTNCFEIIYKKGFSDIYSYKRKVYRKNSNLILHINKLIRKINKDYNNIINKKEIENSKLKMIYKSNILFNIYKMLAIFYRYETQICKFNISELENSSNCLSKEFFEKFYEYLNSIQDLQLIFDLLNKDLTSHSNEVIDLEIVNKHYEQLTNNKSILNKLNTQKRELYDICLVELKKLRSDLM